LFSGQEAPISGSYYSVPVFCQFADSLSFVFSLPTTGTPTGTITLLRSIDQVGNLNNTPNAAEIQNWTLLWAFQIAPTVLTTFSRWQGYGTTGSNILGPFAVSGGTVFTFDDDRVNYSWFRFGVTATTGTAIPTAKLLMRGSQGR
jgi:hypothetical protein